MADHLESLVQIVMKYTHPAEDFFCLAWLAGPDASSGLPRTLLAAAGEFHVYKMSSLCASVSLWCS